MLVVWTEITYPVVYTDFDVPDVRLDGLGHALNDLLHFLEDLAALGHYEQKEFVLGVKHGKGFLPNLLVCIK